jgi:hypothetical protein
MARKTVIQNDERVQEALEEFKILTELRMEMAQDALKAQDEETQKVIWRIAQRLAVGASGYIKVRVNPPHGSFVPVKVDPELVQANTLFVATEILKDLAMFDVRVANYVFPPITCVSCGVEITAPKNGGRKRG